MSVDYSISERRSAAATAIIAKTFEEQKESAADFFTAWARYVEKREYGRLCLRLPHGFGRMQMDTHCSHGFSLAPWRSHLPGVAALDYYDIIDMERWLGGFLVGHPEKYQALWDWDAFWPLYEDAITNMRLRFAASTLKGIAEVKRVKRPTNYEHLLSATNTLVFGTPFDPRINPLMFTSDALQQDVTYLATGCVEVPPELAYTAGDIPPAKVLYNTCPRYSLYPELLPFVDLCIDIDNPTEHSKFEGPVFYEVPSPGCAVSSGEELEQRHYLRIPMSLKPTPRDRRNITIYMSYLLAYLLDLRGEGGGLGAASFILTHRNALVLADHLPIPGPIYLDFDALYFWASQALDFSSDGEADAAKKAVLARSAVLPSFSLHAHLWMHICRKVIGWEGASPEEFAEVAFECHRKLRLAYGWVISDYIMGQCSH